MAMFTSDNYGTLTDRTQYKLSLVVYCVTDHIKQNHEGLQFQNPINTGIYRKYKTTNSVII